MLGSGAVYMVDGSTVTHSNIAEERKDRPLCIYDVKLHVLSHGDAFDLRERRPGEVSRQEAVEVQVKEAEAREAEAKER